MDLAEAEDIKSLEDLMERVDLFHGLTDDEVRKIFAKGMTMRCVQGEILFKQGTVGSQMYVVLSGKIGVFDGDRCFAKLEVGDMFGEMALVNDEPRSATVKALEDSRVFILTKDRFERLLTKRVAVTLLLNIVRTLSDRLRESNARSIG